MSTLTDLQLMILEKEHITCEDFEDLLDDYVDNALPISLRARLDVHLEDCAQCQETLEGYRLTIALAKDFASTEAAKTLELSCSGVDFDEDDNEEKLPQEVSDRLRKSLNARLGLNL